LGNLADLELANTKKIGKKTVYNAAPPEKLEEFLADQEKELSRQKNTLTQIMGDLGSVYRLAHNKPGVRFFEGIEGIKEVLEDTLRNNTQKMILTFSDAAGYSTYLKDWNTNYYAPKRKKLGIFEKVIIPDSPKALEFLRNYKSNEVTEVLFVDHKNYPFKTEINIYENKISFVTFSEKTHIGVIINNDEIVHTLTSVFNLLWMCGQKYYKDTQPEWIKNFGRIEKTASKNGPSNEIAKNEDGTSTVFKPPQT
jgi:sugar-specific transcriptional regulator TrmB